MAYIVGLVTKEEKEELQRRGWEVEKAEDYNLIGDCPEYLLEGPHDEDEEAVVIFVDSNVFEVMNGPDWEKS